MKSFTGRLPFAGDSGMEVLMNVINKDAEPPRKHQANIPVDLETIILKSMEKEPDRRYSSARALAEDLRRFADNEPVLARRPTWTSTVTKKIRKNPVVSGLLAAGLVIALSAISFAIYTRYRASEQTRYANEFNLEAQDIQQRLRYFYTQPAHDVRAEEETIRKRLQKLEADLKQASTAAQGPGSYVLGLGYFGLGITKVEKIFGASLESRELSSSAGRLMRMDCRWCICMPSSWKRRISLVRQPSMKRVANRLNGSCCIQPWNI